MLDIPENYLEIYDRFDLSEREQRRVAARALFDFYSDLLAQAGKKSLEFQPKHINDASMAQKWNVAKSRLQSIESVEIDEDYSRVLNRLGRTRNELEHNPYGAPELAVLEEAREIASDWALWFDQAVESYETEISELSAKETMERIVQETVKEVRENPAEIDYEDLSQRQESLNRDADNLLERLEEATTDGEGIMTELVFVLADAKSLEQDKQELVNDRSIRLEEEEERLQRQAEWRDYKNTYPCTVVSEYDPEWHDEVCVAAVSGWRSGGVMCFNPYHPETPEEIREKLAKLEEGDEIGLTFGFDRHQDRYVKEYSPTPKGY